jgi:hypothetical protein
MIKTLHLGSMTIVNRILKVMITVTTPMITTEDKEITLRKIKQLKLILQMKKK